MLESRDHLYSETDSRHGADRVTERVRPDPFGDGRILEVKDWARGDSPTRCHNRRVLHLLALAGNSKCVASSTRPENARAGSPIHHGQAERAAQARRVTNRRRSIPCERMTARRKRREGLVGHASMLKRPLPKRACREPWDEEADEEWEEEPFKRSQVTRRLGHCCIFG